MDKQEDTRDRNSALDFTKGVLVLFMVLYHWMNYFVGIEGPVYPYIRFIPPSFIFISGFLLANVYPTKYGLSESQLYLRLIVRGAKLLALFTILNVMANVLFSRSYKGAMPGVEGFMNDAFTIYISGNARVAFGVLVPIGYLLILSIWVFLAMRVHKHAVHLICAMSFLCVWLLDVLGFQSTNLSFVAIGLLGMVFGFYPIQTVNNWAGHLYVVACLNVGYIFVMSILGEKYLLQVIGVCLSVMFIYMAAVRTTSSGAFRDSLILLGRYSLFGYIAQIALLQLLQRILSVVSMTGWALWIVSFVGAFTLTILAVMIAHQIRTRSSIADKMYRVVFA